MYIRLENNEHNERLSLLKSLNLKINLIILDIIIYVIIQIHCTSDGFF